MFAIHYKSFYSVVPQRLVSVTPCLLGDDLHLAAMIRIGASVICLLFLFVLDVQAHCDPETQCFGNGNFDKATNSCTCYARQRTGLYTGECCESIGCKANATCKHGYCGPDGLTCARCQTGWGGPNCENVTSCFPWFHCREHGSCKKSRSKCDCEPGWVGDLCDRSLCQVPCKFGACPNDPKKCECYDNYFGESCNSSYCGEEWECRNGGNCIDLHHCACPPHYTGDHCETVSECSVPCNHGRCNHKPDVCECEPNWGPPGDCSIYEGPCLNCSSAGGTCKAGPTTCKCKPGYEGSQCSVQTCDGCGNGRCHHGPKGKVCACHSGWINHFSFPPKKGFDPTHGPCTKVRFCMEPCVHGSCPNDPYTCECTPPYVGPQCDVMQCPKCCPPQTCDCKNPNRVECHHTWHHDCCLLKSCFRGDTLVHTDKGLVPIENIKEGDMVVTRHEEEDASVTHFRRVDQVRKRFIPKQDLVVFRMQNEDIWVTPDHPFFETGTSNWMSAVNVTTSHSLQGLQGKPVKLQQHLKASQLLGLPEKDGLVAVYDLSVHEYDRYAVGKDGLLVSACSDIIDLVNRDKQVWGDEGHPNSSSSGDAYEPQTVKIHKVSRSGRTGFYAVVVTGGVLGAMCLIMLSIVLVRKYRSQHADREPLVVART